MPDAPFLVDTVRAAVQGAGHRVRLLLHPIVGIERDAEGASCASPMRASRAVASRSCGSSSSGR